jgi:hypothetical protein
MRPEARDKFLKLADATAKELGGDSFQDGIALARKWLSKLTEMFDSIRTPEMLAQRLDETEIAPENEWLMFALAGFGPQLLRWIFASLNRNAEVTLPNFPNRRPAIATNTQIEMLRFINDLHFNHAVELQKAKSRAAQRFGCGVRTVERYWREREEILANGPKPQFADLIEGIKAAIAADK